MYYAKKTAPVKKLQSRISPVKTAEESTKKPILRGDAPALPKLGPPAEPQNQPPLLQSASACSN